MLCAKFYTFAPMRRSAIILLLLFLMQAASAQTEGVGKRLSDDGKTGIGRVDATEVMGETIVPTSPAERFEASPTVENPSDAFEYTDSLRLPVLNRYGQTPLLSHPLSLLYGMGDWRLHRGLNLNVGASVFGSWGGSRYLGTGFSQNISLMYALPLSRKLSLAVGGYFNNTFFSSDSYRDAGLNAVLGYRFNEHWEAYVYGQKSIVQSRMPLPLYGMSNIGDRIGAAVKYNFNPSFSVQLNVEWANPPGLQVPTRHIDEHPRY